MKNIFYIIMLQGICMCANSQGYTINAKIDGLRDGTKVYLIHFENGMVDTISTESSKNGGFRFRGVIPLAAEWYIIAIDTGQNYIKILMDNSTVLLNGSMQNLANMDIKGSESHEDYIAFKNQLKELNDSLAILQNAPRPPNDSAQISHYQNRINSIRTEIKFRWLSYINANPHSLYTPFLIKQSKLSFIEKEIAYNSLSKKVKESYYGIEVKKMLQAEKNNDNIKVGGLSPDFLSKTPSGDTVSLKEIVSKSKITLLDFWASWCTPCRKENPDNRIAYDKFNKLGFNILSVALDSDKTKWKNAILEDKMIWENVSQLKGRNEEAAQIFNVNGIPAKLLLDKNMKIIAISLPGSKIESSEHSLSGSGLIQLLENYFNNK